MRLSFYKRIAAAENKTVLNELKVELIDRFGLLPEATKNLFCITALRLAVKPLGILRIDAGMQGGFLEFSPHADICPDNFIRLIRQQPTVYRFDGPLKFKFVKNLPTNQDRVEFVENLINALGGEGKGE